MRGGVLPEKTALEQSPAEGARELGLDGGTVSAEGPGTGCVARSASSAAMGLLAKSARAESRRQRPRELCQQGLLAAGPTTMRLILFMGNE